MKIKASEVIETAFSEEDARRLDAVISQGLAQNEIVEIDFTGIRFFTTLFFNHAICKYVLSLGEAKFDQCFVLQGLTEVGKSTYQHSLENARNFAGLSPQEREAQMKITDTPEEE